MLCDSYTTCVLHMPWSFAKWRRCFQIKATVIPRKHDMLRINIFHNLKNFQAVASSCQYYRVNSFVGRIFSSSVNIKSAAGSGSKLFHSCRISVLRARNFHATSPMNGRLQQMFEDLQKKTRESSKQKQLLSSFDIVRQIQKETELDELLVFYDALKDKTKVDVDDLVVLYAQVALLHRFALLAGCQSYHRLTTVMSATVHLANIIRWNSNMCEPTHLASTVHGIAALGFKDLSYFIHFDKEIRRRNPRMFKNADLAMILWAYGKAQFRAKLLYKFIRNEIMARDFSTFQVGEICQFVWAYARTLEKGAKLFAPLRDEIMKRDLTLFEERSLVIILWSYAEVGFNVKPMFRHIKLEILRRGLGHFTHKQMAQIVSSYAQQNIRAPDLFQEISTEIIERGSLDFAPVGLVMIVNSFAKTKNYIRDLFKLIENRLLFQDLSVYDPAQVVRFLWAYTDARLLTEPLFYKLTDEILLSDFSSLNDSCLEELVKALQGSRCSAPKLVAKTEAELVRRSESQE